MNPIVWSSIVSGLFLVIGATITGAILIKSQREARVYTDKIAKMAKESSATSVVINRKLDAIHTLVNSATGVLLKERVIDTKRIADFTSSAEDIQRWQDAVLTSQMHDKQQSILDALLKQQDVFDAEKRTPNAE